MIALGAIFKNEGPYILEWVAFHRVLGIQKFFIADNNSDDGTSELLSALDALGLVRHIPFPHVPGEPPQLPAYTEIMARYGGEADWVAFIDADEFLVPTDGSRAIAPAFANLGEDVGAVVVNWAVYGSSNRKEPSQGLVIERFTQRAHDDFQENFHYKTIVRTSAYARHGGNPHQFVVKRDFRIVHANGEPLADHPVRGGGLSKTMHGAPLRLHHYAVKSRAEFDRKKTPRGSATVLTRRKGARYFANHDMNDVNAPVPGWLTEATKEEMERIRTQLRRAGCDEAFVALDSTIASLKPYEETDPARVGRGFVDRIYSDGEYVRVRGWAFTSDGKRADTFSVKIGDHAVAPVHINRMAREDICKKFSISDKECGFLLSFSILDVPNGFLTSGPVEVQAGTPAIALKLTNGVTWPTETVRDLISLPKIPSVPAMPPDVVRAFREAMSSSKCYLEYGSGGSTVMACEAKIPSVICVESDLVWLKAVREKLNGHHRPEALHLRHVNIGPTREWGYPVSEKQWRHWPLYALDCWNLCRNRNLQPDLVLIDGRFRVSCFLATLIFAQEGCRVFFDDYADRPHYHQVERFLKPVRIIGRAAEFLIPNRKDFESLWMAFVLSIGSNQ